MSTGPASPPVADGQPSKLSDNWLIKKALQCFADGKAHEARAWILTAKSLYPKDFSVQHEVLQMQITSGQLGDAAVLLCTLLRDFPEEQRLWGLVERMLHAVERRRLAVSLEQESLTLTALFTEMDESLQKKVIVMFAEHVKADDTLKYCRILMLAMRLHSDTVLTCAMPAVDALSSNLSGSSVSPSRNEVWHLLVVELLPTILSSKQLQVTASGTSPAAGCLAVPSETMTCWLELTMQFYVDMAMHREPSSSAAASSLLSPTRSRRFSLDAASGGDMHEAQPWKCAWRQLADVAELCRWTGLLESGALEKGLPLLERAQKLQALAGTLLGVPVSDNFAVGGVTKPHFPASVTRDVSLSVFYPAILTWLESCWSYLHPAPIPGHSLGSIILLDLPQSRPLKDTAMEPEAKRRKGLENVSGRSVHLSLHPSLSSTCGEIVDQFQAAVQQWQLLERISSLKAEYQRVTAAWGSAQWSWLVGFQRDAALYNGDGQGLASGGSVPDDEPLAVRLQNTFALFSDGHMEAACQQAVEIFGELGDEDSCLPLNHQLKGASSSSCTASSATVATVRELQLTPCTPSALVPLVVRMLLCYYESMSLTQATGDDVLGHMLVLCQYNWPQFESQLCKVVGLILQRGSFKYLRFFDYVNSVDVLEEVSFLHNSGCKLVLSSGNGTPAKRTVTRGVNKGAKEEIRCAIERQVMTVDGSSNAVIKRLVTFLKNETLL